MPEPVVRRLVAEHEQQPHHDRQAGDGAAGQRQVLVADDVEVDDQRGEDAVEEDGERCVSRSTGIRFDNGVRACRVQEQLRRRRRNLQHIHGELPRSSDSPVAPLDVCLLSSKWY